MRASAGRVCFLKEHIARLLRGLSTLEIDTGSIEERAREGMRQVLDELAGDDTLSVKLIVTRGVGPAGPTMRGGFAPTVIVIGSPDAASRPASMRAVTSSAVRNERSRLCSVKSLNYTKMLLARAQAERAGVDDAIVLNTSGNVAEASAANVYSVVAGSVLTPAASEGCLPGIVRGAVRGVADDLSIGMTLGKLPLETLRCADEAFLTNSRIGVAPLVELDGRPIGSGAAGEVTMRIRDAYLKKEQQSGGAP